MEHKNFTERHPIFISILYTLLTLLFMTVAGAILTINKASGTDAYLIQSLFVWISAVVGLCIMLFSRSTLKEYGFRFKVSMLDRKLFWLLPIIIIEILPVIAGFDKELTLYKIILYIVFSLGVGLNEEIYFRGLILKTLKSKGTSYAIIISSIIFGVAHMINILGGKDLVATLLQITFAALFGLVFAEIAILKKTIIIPIIWHTLHDFFVISTRDVSSLMGNVILGTQTLILFIYAIYLWRQLKYD